MEEPCADAAFPDRLIFDGDPDSESLRNASAVSSEAHPVEHCWVLRCPLETCPCFDGHFSNA